MSRRSSALAFAGFLALGTLAPRAGAAEPPDYVRAFHQGDYPGARALAAEQLQDQPDSVEARIFLGLNGSLRRRLHGASAGPKPPPRQSERPLYYVGLTAGALAQQESDRLLAWEEQESNAASIEQEEPDPRQ